MAGYDDIISERLGGETPKMEPHQHAFALCEEVNAIGASAKAIAEHVLGVVKLEEKMARTLKAIRELEPVNPVNPDVQIGFDHAKNKIMEIIEKSLIE